MSRCFTWFSYKWIRRTKYIPSISLFYKNEGFYLEELGQGCRII